jgi:hypothetical protein
VTSYRFRPWRVMKKLWMTRAGLFLTTTVWMASSTGRIRATLADYSRATNVDTNEVTIHCEDGGCVIPFVVPWTFQLGSVTAPYDAVVTASFTYKTSKGLKVTASLLVQPIGTPPPTYDISVSDVTLVVEGSQPS